MISKWVFFIGIQIFVAIFDLLLFFEACSSHCSNSVRMSMHSSIFFAFLVLMCSLMVFMSSSILIACISNIPFYTVDCKILLCACFTFQKLVLAVCLQATEAHRTVGWMFHITWFCCWGLDERVGGMSLFCLVCYLMCVGGSHVSFVSNLNPSYLTVWFHCSLLLLVLMCCVE